MYTCGTCYFFLAAEENPEQGQCFGNPPTPLPVQVQAFNKVALPNGKASTQELSLMSLTPPVTAARRACHLWTDVNNPFVDEEIEGEHPIN